MEGKFNKYFLSSLEGKSKRKKKVKWREKLTSIRMDDFLDWVGPHVDGTLNGEN